MLYFEETCEGFVADNLLGKNPLPLPDVDEFVSTVESSLMKLQYLSAYQFFEQFLIANLKSRPLNHTGLSFIDLNA